MKKVIAKYKQIAGAKINFDKSEGLQVGAWAFPLEWQTRPHPQGVAQARKWQGRGVCRVYLPLDPLPFVCASSA